MQLWEAGAIFAAGGAAGAINAAVGSGTLVTFSTLVALGYSPLVANISNSVGLIAGSVAGSWGYRKELRGWGSTLLRMLPWSVAGGVLGSLLLLVLPSSAFDAVVPVLVGLAVIMVILQPRLAARVRAKADATAAIPADGPPDLAGTSPAADSVPWTAPLGPLLLLLVTLCGVYGGYFGAAQGVLMLGVLGWLFTDSLQLANGLKNVLTAAVNAVAALMFTIVASNQINWIAVLLMAAGSLLGGLTGAALSRRAPPIVLRGLIVVVGVVAIARLTVWS